MKIMIMRHYKVDLKFDKYYDSAGFKAVSIAYNRRPVIDQEHHCPLIGKLYSSSMRRAKETARLAYNQEPEVLKGVYEVTMNSYRDTKLNLPRWWWELMARIHWRYDVKTQYETHIDTIARLKGAIDYIERQSEDATIVMHGMVMRSMSKLLRKRGYKGKQVIHAKNGQCYVFER